jgi:uncharacterized protein with HEPN domain
MRSERLYLADIVEAADRIAEFLAGVDEATFLDDELVRSAVFQKLTIIGEAAAHLSDELTARNPHVPWPAIVSFRNILVHAYFSIDWLLVWDSATREVPELRQCVLAMPELQPGP